MPHSFINYLSNDLLDFSNYSVLLIFHCGPNAASLIDKTSSICSSYVVECGVNNSSEADLFTFNSISTFLIYYNLTIRDDFENLNLTQTNKNTFIGWSKN